MSAVTLPTAPGVSRKEGELSPPPPVRRRLTFAEYMEIERASPVRHNFIDGEMVKVAGASLEHNTICMNVGILFGNALEEADCRALGSDQKVWISSRRGYYPDITVACGQLKVTLQEVLQNPLLIAEVLSPSTAALDRGDKFRDYRTIPSLEHYLLIEQHTPAVEHFRRNGGGKWELAAERYGLDQTLELTIGGVAISLPLTKIYRNVTFPEAPPEEGGSLGD